MFPNHGRGLGGMWLNNITFSTPSATYTPHATYTVRPDGAIHVGPPDPTVAQAVQAQVQAGMQEMQRGMQVMGQEMQRGMQDMQQEMQSMFGSMGMGLMGGPQMGSLWTGGMGMPARGSMPPPPPPQAPMPPPQASMPTPQTPAFPPQAPMPQSHLGGSTMPPGPLGAGSQSGPPGT